MAKTSDELKQELEAAAREAVQHQLDHRSRPKDQALLNLLSKDTSDKPQSASTSGASNRLPDRELIEQIIAKTGMSEEEAVRELELYGGL